MKKIIKFASVLALVFTFTGCTTTNECQYKKHHNYDNGEMCTQHKQKNYEHKKHHKNAKKLHSKMYSRNKQGGVSEIGYVKFYDTANGVKMFVNVENLRDGVDYTTKIYQCKDAKCTNPDTCCMETSMSLEMPLTRKDKSNSMLQETFFINNVTTDQLQGATVFFERDNGYRAAWGFLD